MCINDIMSQLNTKYSGITINSKEVKNNFIYFAMKSTNYINEAMESGATLVVLPKTLEFDSKNIDVIKVDDIDEAYNKFSCHFYDNPQEKLKIIATTGTNGKTTTSWIINDLLNQISSCGYIGTVGIKYSDISAPSPYTTLFAHQYAEYFNKMVKQDVKNVAIELSSHGLDQKRLTFCNFDLAIMTNLTHDHLDYHGDMQHYLDAKLKIFSMLKNDGYAILNIDDKFFNNFKDAANSNILTYGLSNNADIQAFDIELNEDSTNFNLKIKDDIIKIKSPLVSLFNVYNLLAAIAVLVTYKIDIKDIPLLVSNISEVEGRMVKLKTSKGTAAYVDYSHTPDSFKQVFEYINSLNKEKIITVFGATGDRDKSKRQILGKIASNNSDYIILTEDDPYTEDNESIQKEVAAGIEDTDFEFIQDRIEAINKAKEIATDKDIIVCLSKGQEKYIIRNGSRDPYPGDDIILKK